MSRREYAIEEERASLEEKAAQIENKYKDIEKLRKKDVSEREKTARPMSPYGISYFDLLLWKCTHTCVCAYV